jgi:thiol-disulfide isomerase/thioredoxin
MFKKLINLSVLLQLLLFISCGNEAKEMYSLSGKFEGPITITKIELQQYKDEMVTLIDTVVSNQEFEIILPNSMKKGLYRIVYFEGESSSGFDFIVTNTEDIAFTIELSKTQFNKPVFSKSERNNEYYKQVEIKNKLIQQYNTQKMEWAKGYGFGQNASQDSLALVLTNTVAACKASLQDIPSKYPLVKDIIKYSSPNFLFNKEQSPREQDSIQYINYWKELNVNKPELVNTTAYSSLIYNYINYGFAMWSHLPHAIQLEKSKEGIDEIFRHFTNEETRKFAINYLSKGFKQLGREDLLQYVDLNYSSIEQCENPNDLKKRLEGYEKLKVGNIAPPIVFDGKNILDNITDTAVVVFWATWCEHCRMEIPALNEYQKRKKIPVFAISLDEDKEAFKIVSEQLSDFSNYCDYKKWDSPTVKNYYVKGTPTYILIDKDKKIIGKYISIKDVVSILGE